MLSMIADVDLMWSVMGNGAGPTIGLVQEDGAAEPGGGWGWTSGQVADFVPWNRGEPDNRSGGAGNDEQYAVLTYDPERESRMQAGVSDYSSATERFIVEIE